MYVVLPFVSNSIIGPTLSESFVNALIQILGFSTPPMPKLVISCHVLSAPVEETNPSFAFAVAVSHWVDDEVVLASNGIWACELPSVEEYLTITANCLPVSVIGFVILIVLYSFPYNMVCHLKYFWPGLLFPPLAFIATIY